MHSLSNSLTLRQKCLEQDKKKKRNLKPYSFIINYNICAHHFFAICVTGAPKSNIISSWMFISCSAESNVSTGPFIECATASLLPLQHLHQVLPLLLLHLCSCFII